jgi:hypothetical protein
VAVYFNHGDRRVVVDHREIKLGKAFVVTRLQTLLQAHRIHLPESEEASILAEELLKYEVKVAEDANDRYGAFRVGIQLVGMPRQKEDSWDAKRPGPAERQSAPATETRAPASCLTSPEGSATFPQNPDRAR